MKRKEFESRGGSEITRLSCRRLDDWQRPFLLITNKYTTSESLHGLTPLSSFTTQPNTTHVSGTHSPFRIAPLGGLWFVGMPPPGNDYSSLLPKMSLPRPCGAAWGSRGTRALPHSRSWPRALQIGTRSSARLVGCCPRLTNPPESALSLAWATPTAHKVLTISSTCRR